MDSVSKLDLARDTQAVGNEYSIFPTVLPTTLMIQRPGHERWSELIVAPSCTAGHYCMYTALNLQQGLAKWRGMRCGNFQSEFDTRTSSNATPRGSVDLANGLVACIAHGELSSLRCGFFKWFPGLSSDHRNCICSSSEYLPVNNPSVDYTTSSPCCFATTEDRFLIHQETALP